MEQIEQSIERYLAAMDTADRTQPDVAEAKTSRLKEKIAKLKGQMQDLKAMEQRLREAPDGQVSLTDPDARSMATSGRGTGVVGYNVQTAVDDKHHLIVAHEVTNVGHDRAALATMAEQARAATGIEDLNVVADRGYFSGEEILACEHSGITAYVPKPLTSNSKADGRFRQTGFRLRSKRGRIPLSRRTALDQAFYIDRECDDPAQLLELSMPRLRDQGSMHHGQRAASQTLGARGGDRGDATATRP